MCAQALQAAFGDPDRAFQYLMDGIPQMPPGGGAGAGNPMAGMPPGMDPNAVADYGDEGQDAGADAGGDAGLAALQAFAQNPAFIPLRQRMI